MGTAEHTDLDAHFEQLLQRADKTKLQTERLLRCTENLLHPDPSKFGVQRRKCFTFHSIGIAIF